MACGVPVVMSRTQVDSEFFDESLVRFFEPGNADSLAEAILAEYQCAETRRARASRASSFVSTIDWSTKQADYLNIMDKVAHA
jgi:glycosyltransferase involved in cell wall biosynthesis